MKVSDFKPFAVFVLATTKEGGYAAGTRPEGGIGLPGGKVDPGETPLEAATREANEEGWNILIEKEPFFKYNKKWWFKGKNAVRLTEYKEKHRIKNIVLSLEEIQNSGYDNYEAVKAYLGN
jgi:predicted NUDIX family NTP pyrophosphohydrolase